MAPPQDPATIPQPILQETPQQTALPPIEQPQNTDNLPQPTSNGKAITAFIIGILACIGALIPILGLVLAITGIIIGSLSIRPPRKVLAILGVVFSSLGLLFSIAVFVYVYKELDQQTKQPQATLVGTRVLAIDTSCYSVELPYHMAVTQAPGSCTFQALDSKSGEQYTVKVLNVPKLTVKSLKEAAQLDVRNVINAIPGGIVDSEQAGLFSGSPAYTLAITAGDGSAGTISYVYRKTDQGNLIIVLHTQAVGQNYDLAAIEKNWTWQ